MKHAICFLYVSLFSLSLFSQTMYNRVYFEADAYEMTQLSHDIVFEHLSRSEKGFVGEFDEQETKLLLSKARQAKVLIADMSSYYKKRSEENQPKKTRSGGVPVNFHGGTMGGYMTLNQALANLDSMAILYPNLITPKDSIGVTAEGRPINLYIISDNPQIDEPQEHKVLYTALHHAREPQSLATVIYYMWYLLENYSSSDSVVKHLVDDRALYFVPILNPDGYAYNETTNPAGGGMWRKNRSINSATSFGVDLNRNYAYKFAYDNTGSSPAPSSDTYRGAAAFSEKETQAIRDLCLSKNFRIILNYHSYSNVLIYPWGYINQVSPDVTTYDELANRLTSVNGYIAGTCFQTISYVANGGSDDWHYGEQTLKPKAFAFTPEVGSIADGFWPLPSDIIPLAQDNYVQNVMAAWLSGPYIERTRLLPYTYNTTAITLNFQYANFGLDTCLNLRSWFTSTNPYFVSSDTSNTNNILSQTNANATIPIVISNTVPFNTVIQGRVYTKYNNFIFSDTASFIVKNPIGVSDFSSEYFNISPNPALDKITINAEHPFKNLSIEILDISGRLWYQEQALFGKSATVKIGHLAKGMYLIKLTQEDKKMIVKLVKE